MRGRARTRPPARYSLSDTPGGRVAQLSIPVPSACSCVITAHPNTPGIVYTLGGIAA